MTLKQGPDPRTPPRHSAGKPTQGQSTVPSTDQTPRVTSERATVDAKTTTVRLKVGRLMNSEIVVCEPERFIDYYLPKHDMNDVHFVLEFLMTFPEDGGSPVLIPRSEPVPPRGERQDKGEDEEYPDDKETKDAPYAHVFSDFTIKPSSVKKNHDKEKKKKSKDKDKDNAKPHFAHENTQFSPIGRIGWAIQEGLRSREVKTNGYILRICPNTTIISGIDGCNQLIDACLTENADGCLCITDIAVPFEFKVLSNNGEVFKNRGQIASHSVHTFNDDPRRTFVYGITIEDDFVSLWYFSRSHSAKSTVFSMIERPDLLVRVLVSFFCATKEQLGFDPLVTLVGKKDFLYRFPPSETRLDSHYYLTIDSVSEYRSLRLRGRSSRVWKVKRVRSATDHERVNGTKDMILKDVSVSSNAVTEYHMQNVMFKDIEDVSKDPDWRERAVLKDLTVEELDEMATFLEDGMSFRKLFSVITEQHVGAAGPLVCPMAWTLPAVFKNPEGDAHPSSKCRNQASEKSSNAPSTSNKPSGSKLEDTKSVPNVAHGHKGLEPRRQCRFIAEHVYTPLHDVMSLGEAVDIIKGCMLALRIMFCAGWVHRDISSGNIMAFRSSPNYKWQVKLADLEYAKRFPSNQAASATVKTITNYFMPCEIATGQYMFPTTRKRAKQRKEEEAEKEKSETGGGSLVAIAHSYQHDLESIWWLVFYLIIMRVDDDLPRWEKAQDIFQEKMISKTGDARRTLFLRDGPNTNLHKDKDLLNSIAEGLKFGFLECLDDLRINLCVEYQERNGGARQLDPASYAAVIGNEFRTFFDEIEQSREHWGNIKLVTDLELRQRAEYRRKEESILSRESREHGYPAIVSLKRAFLNVSSSRTPEATDENQSETQAGPSGSGFRTLATVYETDEGDEDSSDEEPLKRIRLRY